MLDHLDNSLSDRVALLRPKSPILNQQSNIRFFQSALGFADLIYALNLLEETNYDDQSNSLDEFCKDLENITKAILFLKAGLFYLTILNPQYMSRLEKISAIVLTLNKVFTQLSSEHSSNQNDLSTHKQSENSILIDIENLIQQIADVSVFSDEEFNQVIAKNFKNKLESLLHGASINDAVLNQIKHFLKNLVTKPLDDAIHSVLKAKATTSSKSPSALSTTTSSVLASHSSPFKRSYENMFGKTLHYATPAKISAELTLVSSPVINISSTAILESPSAVDLKNNPNNLSTMEMSQNLKIVHDIREYIGVLPHNTQKLIESIIQDFEKSTRTTSEASNTFDSIIAIIQARLNRNQHMQQVDTMLNVSLSKIVEIRENLNNSVIHDRTEKSHIKLSARP